MASIKRAHRPFLPHKISALTHVEQSGKCIYQRLADSPLTKKKFLLKNGLLAIAFYKIMQLACQMEPTCTLSNI